MEERLEFYKTGKAPRKVCSPSCGSPSNVDAFAQNVDVMHEVIGELGGDVTNMQVDEQSSKKKHKKKRKADAIEETKEGALLLEACQLGC